MAFSLKKKTMMILMLLLLLLIPTSDAQTLERIKGTVVESCNDNGDTYTANSTYLTNLNLLTSSLSLNGSTDGFAEGQFGDVPDRVYGLVLCRGDINGTTCRTCLDAIREYVLDRCPFKKAVTIWYEYCQLRYSDERFASVEGGGTIWFVKNIKNVSSDNWPSFNHALVIMLDNLIQYATNSTKPPRFATGKTQFDGDNIYGTVQCTRDLSADDCNQCLKGKIGYLKACCDQSIGGRVLAQSCYFRYESGSYFSGNPNVYVVDLSNPSSPSSPPASDVTPTPDVVNTSAPPPFQTSSANNTADEYKKKSTGTIVAIAIPTGSAFILLLFCFASCLIRKRILKQRCQQIASEKSLLFDLKTVKTATNNFSELNKLGEGGFGVVYKGNLADVLEIAVKRLPATGQGLNELKNEVFLLSKLRHKNLVKLLGVCLEGEEKFLVYEYVHNRSLDTFLFDPRKKEKLPWERRRSIIEGISRGMLYLHEESQVKIIHRDLKASNILLDANMNPKISDFGLARLFSVDQTHACTTKVVGTFGYMSPEYVINGQISSKSDVFSFGVLILEIVTGRKNNDFIETESSPAANLLSHVWERWLSGRLAETVDPSLAGNYPHGEVLRCIQIALMCVQENPSKRPTMSAIVLMLSTHSVSVSVPSRPGFVGGLYMNEGSRITTEAAERNHYSDDLSSKGTSTKYSSLQYSTNEMSITDMEVR